MTRKTASLILLWLLVTGLGLAAGLGIAFWLETEEDYIPIFLMLGFLIGGALMGLGQWALLQTQEKSSWLWIPATALGITLGLSMGILVSDFIVPVIIKDPDWSYFIVTALIAGAVTGAFQWLFTGRKVVNAKWIFVSAIGFLGLVISFPNTENPIYAFVDAESWALDVVLFGSLFGIFTGTVTALFILPQLSTLRIRERILNGRSITFLSIIVIASIVSKLFLYDDGYSNPLFLSRYSTYGFYEIFPETILESLNQGQVDVFTLASEEILDRDEPYYEEIRWSQSDYLKISDALSKEVWHEPLDLSQWQILDLSLHQACTDEPQGFYDFTIVYFQPLGIKYWSRQYHVRIIEIFSWQGILRWGESTFSDAILPGWGNTNLNDFQVTADSALHLAEINGGSKARQKVNNACRISVWVNNYRPVGGYTDNSWLVEYQMADFHVRIDPFSGKFETTNADY